MMARTASDGPMRIRRWDQFTLVAANTARS